MELVATSARRIQDTVLMCKCLKPSSTGNDSTLIPHDRLAVRNSGRKYQMNRASL